jgi:hypothetical protein
MNYMPDFAYVRLPTLDGLAPLIDYLSEELKDVGYWMGLDYGFGPISFNRYAEPKLELFFEDEHGCVFINILHEPADSAIPGTTLLQLRSGPVNNHLDDRAFVAAHDALLALPGALRA